MRKKEHTKKNQNTKAESEKKKREKQKTKKMANGRLDATIAIFVMKLCCELLAICAMICAQDIVIAYCAVQFLFETYDMERAVFKLCTYLAKVSIDATTTTKKEPKRRLNTVHCSFNETIKMRRRTENGRWPFRSLQCQSAYLLNECDEIYYKRKKRYMNRLGAFISDVELFIQPISCYQFENVSLWTQLIICCIRCHHNVIF